MPPVTPWRWTRNVHQPRAIERMRQHARIPFFSECFREGRDVGLGLFVSGCICVAFLRSKHRGSRKMMVSGASYSSCHFAHPGATLKDDLVWVVGWWELSAIVSGKRVPGVRPVPSGRHARRCHAGLLRSPCGADADVGGGRLGGQDAGKCGCVHIPYYVFEFPLTTSRLRADRDETRV